MFKCYDLLCEYLENPMGIDEKHPMFSWKIDSDKENTLQTAYELEIDGVWKSGKVESDNPIYNVYGGTGLKPMTRYTYRVRVYDNYGRMSDWSEAWFETGLMENGFTADWISTQEEVPPLGTVFVFKKKFSIKDISKPARIYATALGCYEIELNGERIGDSWLAPGFTSYHNQLLYQTYDVTGMLKEENEVRITLAEGWCRGRSPEFVNPFGCLPCVIMELHADDGEIVVCTDESWEYSEAAYLMSSIYDGEIYDATIEDDSYRNWRSVIKSDYSKSHISAQQHEPVRICEEVKPIELIKTPKGETVIDFGQNMVGWAEFKATGKKGDKVILNFAEVLDKDGNFYIENMRTAKNHIEYRLRGEGEETFHPHFTFQGFRYVRIEEYPGEVMLDNFVGRVLHSDFKRTGKFSCSNESVNRLFENVIWGQRGNFVDVPTDCPQRDERLGWTGDAQVFIRAAALNYRVTSFFRKWLTDVRLDQNYKNGVPFVVPNTLNDRMPEGLNLRPRGIVDHGKSSAWGDCATICPWEIYRAFGDRRILENQFESMKGWVEYVRRQGTNEYTWNDGFHFGDWVALDAKEGSYRGRTAEDFIATVYYAHSAGLTAKAAEVLGKKDEQKKYEELAEKIREEFNKEFVTPNGRLTDDTQTAHILALNFDMTDNKERLVSRLAKLIVDNDGKLTTGFLGTPYLCHALTENGRADMAYDMLLQTEYPSWLYSVSKGATTIWEHWDGIKPDGSFWSADMNSFNHYAYGSIADWMYTKAAGINYDEKNPGYARIIIKPYADKRLDFVSAELETMYGKVVSEWRWNGDELRYHIEIPCGSVAEFVYPDGTSKELGSGVYEL